MNSSEREHYGPVLPKKLIPDITEPPHEHEEEDRMRYREILLENDHDEDKTIEKLTAEIGGTRASLAKSLWDFSYFNGLNQKVLKGVPQGTRSEIRANLRTEAEAINHFRREINDAMATLKEEAPSEDDAPVRQYLSLVS